MPSIAIPSTNDQWPVEEPLSPGVKDDMRLSGGWVSKKPSIMSSNNNINNNNNDNNNSKIERSNSPVPLSKVPKVYCYKYEFVPPLISVLLLLPLLGFTQMRMK